MSKESILEPRIFLLIGDGNQAQVQFECICYKEISHVCLLLRIDSFNISKKSYNRVALHSCQLPKGWVLSIAMAAITLEKGV